MRWLTRWSLSMVEHELRAVEQRPEDVGQGFLRVEGRAAALDVGDEAFELLGSRAAGRGWRGRASRSWPGGVEEVASRRRPARVAPRSRLVASATSRPFISVRAWRIDVCRSVGLSSWLANRSRNSLRGESPAMTNALRRGFARAGPWPGSGCRRAARASGRGPASGRRADRRRSTASPRAGKLVGPARRDRADQVLQVEIVRGELIGQEVEQLGMARLGCLRPCRRPGRRARPRRTATRRG